MLNKPFVSIYRDLLHELLSSTEELNKRTGTQVKVLRGGASFRLDLSDRTLPTIGTRKTYPATAAAEIAWFLSGSNDLTWLRKYSSIWDMFVEDDDRTVQSAYGYRWRRHFGRDQIVAAIGTLSKDPTNRRVWVSAWDPAEDGLGMPNQKNVPCPVGFSLTITDGELHSTLAIRSSDVFVGLPYDVMGHALLMDALAAQLEVSVGVMQVSIAHAHLYESHWDLADFCSAAIPTTPDFQLPNWSVHQIIGMPDRYVGMMRQLQKQVIWPTFNPKPIVIP